MIRAAFDIETVSPTVPHDEYPPFDDPTAFEVQSGGIAVERDGEIVDRKHITRDGWGAQAEVDVIAKLAQALLEAEADVTYTYNGVDFDFWLLRERARLRADETGERSLCGFLRGLEDAVGHEDIMQAMNDADLYMSLEEAKDHFEIFVDEDERDASKVDVTAYDHGYDPAEWTWRDDPADPLDGGDVAVLGEDYLDGVDAGRDDAEFEQLVAMFDDYVRGDVDHLFRLADARPY